MVIQLRSHNYISTERTRERYYSNERRAASAKKKKEKTERSYYSFISLVRALAAKRRRKAPRQRKLKGRSNYSRDSVTTEKLTQPNVRARRKKRNAQRRPPYMRGSFALLSALLQFSFSPTLVILFSVRACVCVSRFCIRFSEPVAVASFCCSLMYLSMVVRF